MCLKPNELHHFIPKFASRVSKKWSSSPQKRFLNYKGQLKQDSPTSPMMCLPCEHIIGQSEDSFRRYMYDQKYLPQYPESYDRWLSQFAAGLLFRTALFTPFRSPALERSKETLRRYILDEDPLGKYSLLHIRVPFDTEVLRKIRNSIDAGESVERTPYDLYMTAGLDTSVALMIQDTSFLAFHVFWMPVVPSRIRVGEWRNVKIRKRGVFRLDIPQEYPDYYHDFIERRLLEISASIAKSAPPGGRHPQPRKAGRHLRGCFAGGDTLGR